MDYTKFYSEVSDWINACNQQVRQFGMDSSDFWEWVSISLGELCNQYDNNELAKRQAVLLHEWLHDKIKER